MISVVTEIFEILTSGFVEYFQALGNGVSQGLINLFLEVNSETGAITGLSGAGGIIIAFAAVALTIGLSYVLFNYVFSLGNR